MRRGLVRAALLLIGVVVVAGCGLLQPTQGWVFPTAAPLPDGAVAVPIDVAEIPASVAPGVDAFGCPTALLAPVELVVDRSVTPPAVRYVFADSGKPALLEWSWGASAFDLEGIVHVVGADGAILMTEGLVAEDLGGGFRGGGADEVFSVCVGTSLPHRVGEPAPTPEP
jgi:hypothetical protein